jgi:hypothetical protein
VYPSFSGGYYGGRGYRGSVLGFSGGTAVVPGSAAVDWCNLKILTNEKGIIISHTHEGNACDGLILDPDAPLTQKMEENHSVEQQPHYFPRDGEVDTLPAKQ